MFANLGNSLRLFIVGLVHQVCVLAGTSTFTVIEFFVVSWVDVNINVVVLVGCYFGHFQIRHRLFFRFFLEGFEIVCKMPLVGEGRSRKLEILNLLAADMRNSDSCLDAKNMAGECRTPDEPFKKRLSSFASPRRRAVR